MLRLGLAAALPAALAGAGLFLVPAPGRAPGAPRAASAWQAGCTRWGIGQTLEGSFERLYRSEILQENMRLKARGGIYTMHPFAFL